MSSIVGMTSIVCGSDKEKRISYINSIIEDSKKNYSSVLVDILESEKSSIGIAEVRSLIQKSTVTSLTAQHRFFVIYDAHLLTPQAQNALLKLYEEPNKDSTYILESDSYHAFLPTIQSRAVLLDISSHGVDGIETQLVDAYGFPEISSFKKMPLAELFSLCEEYAKDKETAKHFIMYLSFVSRDVIRTTAVSYRQKYISYCEFLLQASEWMKETNVNARLLLENCVLGWWNLSK